MMTRTTIYYNPTHSATLTSTECHMAAVALQEANSSSTCPSKTVPFRTDATSSAFSMLSRMTAPPTLPAWDVFTLHGSRRRNRKRSLAIS